jgi:multicomponent Na+:H+ antiporter subunit D
MQSDDALILLVLLPLASACAALLLPSGWRWLAVAGTVAALPLLLVVLTRGVFAGGVQELSLAGFAPPLGIRLRVDGLTLLLLWLTAIVAVATTLAASASHPPASASGSSFWPLWLLLLGGLNAAFVAADLFNLYVALELLSLASIALIATDGQPEALRAAMRYLLLAMMASLAYLAGVALLYAVHGTLDLYAVGERLAQPGDPATLTALALITVALLLKSAIFPLHVWLPQAHASAPGAVSAVLSALVVKMSVYALYRIWLWTAASLDTAAVFTLLGCLGAAAVLWGSAAALMQSQLKRVVAYSTVAQLGYLLLVFPLITDPRGATSAWMGAGFQVFGHGLAKAAMFLAAAALVQASGSGRIADLVGVGRREPLGLFAFGLAGVSLMGLPPSGGFLAKWLLLEAAWDQRGWIWLAVMMLGSLLAAGYVYKVLSAAFAVPSHGSAAAPGGEASGVDREPVSHRLRAAALGLALIALALGLGDAQLLAMLEVGRPGGLAELAP